MPCFDRTGPMGQGSISGRGKGRCRNDQSVENNLTTERGAGRRFRMRFNANNQEESENGVWQGKGRFAARELGRLHRRRNQ